MKALLIDGLNLIRRVHAGVPGDAESDEHIERAKTACAGSLRRALTFHQPTHTVCVLEGQGESWRHKEFPDYKRNRSPMPDLLCRSLQEFETMFSEYGVKSVKVDGYEADDVLATLATGISNHGGQVVVLTTDKSLCQLLSDSISVYDHFSSRFLDHEYVEKRFGVKPSQLMDLFALMGDTSLNVPGVKGIGVRTAAKLVGDYQSLDKILAAADEMTGNIGAKLRAGKAAALQASRLLSLRKDVVIGVNLKQWRLEHMDD